MVSHAFLLVVAAASGIAAAIWARGARIRWRHLRSVDSANADRSYVALARQSFVADLHTVALYLVVGISAVSAFVVDRAAGWYALSLVAIPVAVTLVLTRFAKRDVALAERQLRAERRALEMLDQEDSIPRLWAERLTPTSLPGMAGFEIGTAHQAGSGVMTGDFLDVFRLPGGRLCCVVGDVMGHGAESSLTALQTKFLLRTFLHRFRDPGQALEELNAQLTGPDGSAVSEEFVSVCVAVFDEEHDTVRYASAGHPAGWLTQDRSIRSMRDTGPLLMMEPDSPFGSREEAFAVGDVLVILTDGLVEVRNESQMFGEERLASLIRRDVDVNPEVLCKTLLGAASEFSEGPITDDVTVMAVRRS